MSDAPESIWAWEQPGGLGSVRGWTDKPTTAPEYIRADLVDGVEIEWRGDWMLENERANAAEAEAANLREWVLEAASVITCFVEETCDYMRINNLGDPEKQHNIKRARVFLAKISGCKQ